MHSPMIWVMRSNEDLHAPWLIPPTAATVACRQLNPRYSRGVAMHGAPYGRGRGPIWLVRVGGIRIRLQQLVILHATLRNVY